MGWLSDKLFGKRKSISLAKLRKYQRRSQRLVNQQLGLINQQTDISQQMMDPESNMNMRMRNTMNQQMGQQAMQQGAQVSADSSGKLGASIWGSISNR